MYRFLNDEHGNPRADVIVRVTDGAFIPLSANNTDWQAYQAWLAAGNTPEPAN